MSFADVHLKLWPFRSGLALILTPKLGLACLVRAYRLSSVVPTVFERLDKDCQFDLVFLDGLHTFDQTYRDLVNAVRHLRAGGIVVIDDVVPSDEVASWRDGDESLAERARRGLEGEPWQGDVYRMVRVLADHHPELSCRTIVSNGNPQAVVWRATRGYATESVGESLVDRQFRVSYNDVFAHGVPNYFRPGGEEEILRQAVNGAR